MPYFGNYVLCEAYVKHGVEPYVNCGSKVLELFDLTSTITDALCFVNASIRIL